MKDTGWNKLMRMGDWQQDKIHNDAIIALHLAETHDTCYSLNRNSPEAMVLKVQIHTLDQELEIELKSDGDVDRLLVISSKSEYTKDPGTAWHAESGNRQLAEVVGRLAIQCYRFPHQPKRITILDGMLMTLHYRDEEGEFNLRIKEFEEDTTEALLLQSILSYCQQLLQDSAFDRYAAYVESYLR